MAQFPPPQGSSVVTTSDGVPTMAALVAYLLLGFAAFTQIVGSGVAAPAPLLTLVGVIGVIVAYVKRSEARGTWLESHMTWLIRTFWWSTLWAAFGWLLAITVIGYPLALMLWAVVSIWVLYRVIRGVLNLNGRRPTPL